MSLTLSRTAPVATRTRPSSRRPVVTVRAGFLEDIGAGFARIFSPRGKDAPATGAPYSGESRRSTRKPLDDVPYAKVKPEDKAAQAAAQTEDTVGYVNKAAQQVVTGNWKGDAEPGNWSVDGDAPSSGWQGDVHSRHREGFHNIKAEVQPQQKPKAAGAEGTAVSKESQGVNDDASNIVSFLGKAAENVVAHNFKGDETEPEQWKNKDQTSSGWKGDIHTRKREGFHQIRQ